MITLHVAEGKTLECDLLEHLDTCSNTMSVYGYSCPVDECTNITNASISQSDLELIWDTTSTTINITVYTADVLA